jgi:hypothetical protein
MLVLFVSRALSSPRDSRQCTFAFSYLYVNGCMWLPRASRIPWIYELMQGTALRSCVRQTTNSSEVGVTPSHLIYENIIFQLEAPIIYFSFAHWSQRPSGVADGLTDLGAFRTSMCILFSRESLLLYQPVPITQK